MPFILLTRPCRCLTGSDVKIKSYICFRRRRWRDAKPMRKTVASQASSSEKFMCLKQEFVTTVELVSRALKREQLKCEASETVFAPLSIGKIAYVYSLVKFQHYLL